MEGEGLAQGGDGDQWEELMLPHPSGHHLGGRQQDWGPHPHLPGPEDRLDWGAGSHAHAQLAQVRTYLTPGGPLLCAQA